jgi:N-acetylglucosaminyldiphosphoundecaprenol N-acetyl-beta-D-mannosaminyltransferase
MTTQVQGLPEYTTLGVRVHALQMSQAIAEMERRIAAGGCGNYVAVTGMHGISEARKDPIFRGILNRACLVVPDGMPLVWLARFHQFPLRRRVCGAELMETFCQSTGARFRHFFYGGAPGVADDLAAQLAARFGIIVAGTYTPPFRPLLPEEVVEVQKRVAESQPHILWVGLSTPKQERWMAEFGPQMQVPLMVGVGAAFDMNAARLSRAPRWMQNSGLEWFYRLVQEPGRLWKRYLVVIPGAAWDVSLELLRLRKFHKANRIMKTP